MTLHLWLRVFSKAKLTTVLTFNDTQYLHKL
jgi:hypothetical protein